MSAESPGAFNQAGSYPAEQSRRAWFGEIATAGGIIGGFDFQLAAPVSGMSVNVGGASGALDQAYIPGSITTTQGVYYGHLTSQTNVSISTSDPSNPRVDSCYAVITDAEYSGITNTFALSIVTGTPTSGASLSNLNGIGAAPSNALLIGYVLVPASATSIITADLKQASPQAYLGNIGPFNARPASGSSTVTANSGDHIIVSSGNTPITLPKPFKNARVKVTNYGSGAPVVSQNASEKILGEGCTSSGVASFLLGAYGATATVESDGTSWYITAGMQDSGFVAVGSFGTNWSSLGSPFRAVSYRLQGNHVLLDGVLTGTALSGTVAFTLPSGYRPPFTAPLGFQVAGASAYVSVATTGGVTVNAAATSGPPLAGLSFTID